MTEYQEPEIVFIARCPFHGLQGERADCNVCTRPVEQIPMVHAGRLAEAEARVAELLARPNVDVVGRDSRGREMSSVVLLGTDGDAVRAVVQLKDRAVAAEARVEELGVALREIERIAAGRDRTPTTSGRLPDSGSAHDWDRNDRRCRRCGFDVLEDGAVPAECKTSVPTRSSAASPKGA